MAWNWDGGLRTVTRLQTARSGVQIPTETRDIYFIQIVQIGFGTHPPSYSMDSTVLSWWKCGRSVSLITHLHLAPRLGISGTIPLLLLNAFMAWTRTHDVTLITTHYLEKYSWLIWMLMFELKREQSAMLCLKF
jgi:hypothetical protein